MLRKSGPILLRLATAVCDINNLLKLYTNRAAGSSGARRLIYFVNPPVVMDAWRMKRNTNKPSKANNGSNSTFKDDKGVMKVADSQSGSLKVQKLPIKCKTRSSR